MGSGLEKMPRVMAFLALRRYSSASFILAILAGPDRVGPEVDARERLVVEVRDVDEREETLEDVRGAETLEEVRGAGAAGADEGAAGRRAGAPLGRPPPALVPPPPPPPPALPNSASRFAE